MRPSLHGLALVARLLARALAMGRPSPVSTAERLANIPLAGAPVEAPVEIRWDAHQVPSIEAGSDRDLAVGLGVVHAHLRLTQMELLRRLARARVAEVIGPVGVALDHALMVMRIGAAVPEMLAALPESSRHWAEGFVAGVNHQIELAPALPHEFRLLGIRPAPWTLEDLLLVSRMAATDISWLVFARLLRSQARLDPAEWARLWPLLQNGDALPMPETAEEAALGLVRGSNAAAVAASRSASGAGLIASDPHLPILLPPIWLIAGLHAPGLDVVGLMLPGLPVVALGRSRHMAWGGTSLHAASSELIDVSDEVMTEREETIPVRGRPPAVVRVRETRFGPVVSDGMLLRSARPFALRWVGHAASDEITAMLGAMRARSLEELRAAMDGFAVPGQTMVAVEAGPAGRATRVIAAHLPRRANGPASGLVTARDQAWDLGDLVRAARLPQPEGDIVASANDRPADTPVPVGFFFSPRDRVRRILSLLEAATPVTAAAMRAMQLDVVHVEALSLRDKLVPLLRPTRRDLEVIRVLAEWDGAYDADSPGALAFETLVGALARRMVPEESLTLLTAVWTGRALIAERIAEAGPEIMQAALRDAARALRRYRNWGGAHLLTLRHPLALLPAVGRWFAYPAYPSP
ncbi:MAG TPA: penicillin acylase family protein, partial [Acetobacteraceae bacterium]|nr:penicillin acylase family protein [Acetobacteraceae bacterium]